MHTLQQPSSLTAATFSTTACFHQQLLPSTSFSTKLRRRRQWYILLLFPTTTTLSVYLLISTAACIHRRWKRRRRRRDRWHWHILSSAELQELSRAAAAEPNCALFSFLLPQPSATVHGGSSAVEGLDNGVRNYLVFCSSCFADLIKKERETKMVGITAQISRSRRSSQRRNESEIAQCKAQCTCLAFISQTTFESRSKVFPFATSRM